MKASETITDLEKVFAPVEKVQTRDLFFNPLLEVPTGMSSAIIRENRVYSLVSDNFSLVQPSEVNKVFDSYLNQFGFHNTIAKMDKKGNFLIRKVKGAIDKNSPEFKNALANGDFINPAIEIFGSIGGTTSLGGLGLAHRPWCANGATTKEKFFEFKAKNTVNTHANKIGIGENFGIDFSKIVPQIEEFLRKFDLIRENQRILQGMEVKQEHILPMFYELTKDTRFPESKFQDAYDILKQEKKDLGYTETNRFLVYNALNYILEHDSLGLDVTLAREVDQVISSKILDLSVGMAMKNFNQIVREQNERDQAKTRGRKKVLELV
jgi:hypothetical protein